MAPLSFRPVTKSQLWQTPSLRTPLFIALLAIITQLAILTLFFPHFPPQIPFFYTLPWGISQLTSPIHLWLLPALSAAILALNWLLAPILPDKLPRQLLLFTASLTSLMATYTLIQILLVIL